MIVKIDRKERDAFEKACSTLAQVKFYTIETNSQMLQVEILQDDGNELSLNMAYHIGRLTGMDKLSNSILK